MAINTLSSQWNAGGFFSLIYFISVVFHLLYGEHVVVKKCVIHLRDRRRIWCIYLYPSEPMFEI